MIPALLMLAQLTGTPHARAVRTSHPPVLDGRIEAAEWGDAPEEDAFTQKFPDERGPPVGRTSFRVLYDDSALYVAIACEQPVPVVARLTRRDRQVEGDWVAIAIDARGDGRSAVELSVNAAGVLSDQFRFDDTEADPDWDEVWDARVARTAKGWSAELRVPFRILRYSSAVAAASWGFQVRRYTSLRRETDEWAYVPRAAAGVVSRYGRLDGLGRVGAGGFVELRPFVLGRIDRSDPGTETRRSGAKIQGLTAGIDVKWHARNDLTLDLSLLPDFAQVEADRLILNLTNEEVALPEKRPFFFEGRDVFATPLALLYTRRIGRVAPPSPALAPGEALFDPTAPARLVGATKLTGRLAEGLRIGSLSAYTAGNDVEVRSASGLRRIQPVEPRALFQVLRLRQELPGNATAGVFASAVVRSESSAAYVREGELAVCPDGARVAPGARCTHDGYVGAADARWRSADGAFAASSQVVGSAIHGGPDRTLRDGTIVRSGDGGVGGTARLSKEGGLLVGDLRYDGMSRKVDFNDAGYMPRANLHGVAANLEYRTLEDWFVTRETHSRAEFSAKTNTDGTVLEHVYNLNTSWKLSSFWEVFLEGSFHGRRFDDREIGDGSALERRELVSAEVEITTDTRRRVHADVYADAQKIFDGFSSHVLGTIYLRILPQLDLALGPEVVYASGEPRFVDRTASALVFGKLDASAVSATVRATYTFTPRLSLDAYAQAFFDAGHFTDFTEFTAPAGRGTIVRRRDLVRVATPSSNPDFVDAALNANLVLRWEYLLGATLYLVYTRSQSPRIELLPGQRGSIDLGGLNRAPATDTILVKATYFFG